VETKELVILLLLVLVFAVAIRWSGGQLDLAHWL
jgi:hypothetical protein